MNPLTNISTLLVFITLFFSIYSAPTPDIKKPDDLTAGEKDVNSTASANSNAITGGQVLGSASGSQSAQTDGHTISGSSSASNSGASAHTAPGGVQGGTATSGAGANALSEAAGLSSADGHNANADVDTNTFGETATGTTANVTVTNNPRDKSQGVSKSVQKDANSVNRNRDTKDRPVCIDGSPVAPAETSSPTGSQGLTTGIAAANSEASQQGMGHSSTGTNTGSLSTPEDAIACAYAVGDAEGSEGSQTSSSSFVGTTAQNSAKDVNTN